MAASDFTRLVVRRVASESDMTDRYAVFGNR